MENTYIIPGFVRFSQIDNSIIVTSELFGNKVKLTDSNVKNEFFSLVQEKGCNLLNSRLKQFLHAQNMLLRAC